MARPVIVLDQILAMLQQIDAPQRVIDSFREHADRLFETRNQRDVTTTGDDGGIDSVSVSSGFGQKAQRGFVDFVLNDHASQMTVEKAREIGLMLIEASEAAIADEVFVKFLAQTGIDSPEARGRALIALREIRQGTRGISRPS